MIFGDISVATHEECSKTSGKMIDSEHSLLQVSGQKAKIGRVFVLHMYFRTFRSRSEKAILGSTLGSQSSCHTSHEGSTKVSQIGKSISDNSMQIPLVQCPLLEISETTSCAHLLGIWLTLARSWSQTMSIQLVGAVF